MEGLEEIRSWVKTLTGPEKRFITLLGKARSGATPSQHLLLFEWINRSSDSAILPDTLAPNLPTLVHRLKSLVLDALRLLDNRESMNSKLNAQLHEVYLLTRRELLPSSLRLLSRTESEAMKSCRYDLVIHCCNLSRQIELERGKAAAGKMLQLLKEKEDYAMGKLVALQHLRQRHDQLRALGRMSMTARNPEIEQEIIELQRDLPLDEYLKKGGWLERALAGNILGMVAMYQKKYAIAFRLFKTLLVEWKAEPSWQKDETGLFINLCKNYQNSCFFHPQGNAKTEEALSLLPSFNHLPPTQALDQQYLIYSSRVLLLLSRAGFYLLPVIRPEIVNWIKVELPRLGETKAMILFFNLAVAEFLNENWKEANRLVVQIQQLPDFKAGEDVRNFCRIFQAILHYELKNVDLNEYLIRSGKRHFSKKSSEDQFELSVLNFLGRISTTLPNAERTDLFVVFEEQLLALKSQLKEEKQVVGLMETILWVRSKIRRLPLSTVYIQELDLIRENRKDRDDR